MAEQKNNTAAAALYVRVSTDAQFEEGYSADAQKEMLEAYCKAKQIKHFVHYTDGGFSGSNIERPQMQNLINDAKANKIQYVIVYKLDRLSRSQKDTLYLIEDVFLPHNVDFVSLNENLDTSTPYGRAMIGILSAFAQLERETIRERTRMGMKERVKRGLWMGGGRIPFGYDYDSIQGILVPNKDAQTVRRIYELYLQGYSCNKIAQLVGLKYEKLALQILMRKSNAGFICYNGEQYAGQHEPIISLETYNQAIDMLHSRSRNKLTTSCHLLTGLVYCGKCGAKMRYQKWGKNGYKLWCYSQDKSKVHLIKDENCDNEKVWADEIEKIVIDHLFQMSLEQNAESTQEYAGDILENLQQKYQICTNKIKRLYGLYAQAQDDILLETIQSYKKELKKIASVLKTEQERGDLAQRAQTIRTHITNISQVWEFMSAQERQTIIRQCVDKITISDGNVKIYYKFSGV